MAWKKRLGWPVRFAGAALNTVLLYLHCYILLILCSKGMRECMCRLHAEEQADALAHGPFLACTAVFKASSAGRMLPHAIQCIITVSMYSHRFNAFSSFQCILTVSMYALVAAQWLTAAHSMEEAEILCDRIGIFVSGRFKCVGAPRQLITRFGGRLILTLTTPVENESDAAKLASKLHPQAKCVYSLAGTQKFELPASEVSGRRGRGRGKGEGEGVGKLLRSYKKNEGIHQGGPLLHV